MIHKYSISRDDTIYEAFPDVTLTRSGRLVCVFSECTHHADRSYTCIMVTTSEDRGRTWSPKRRLTEPLRGNPPEDPWWNCPRISTLADGRLVAVVDRIIGRGEGMRGEQSNRMWFSADEGDTWDGPVATPVHGIVPDQLVELRHGDHAGRWILSAHTVTAPGDADISNTASQVWMQRCWLSDDRGATWSDPIVIASVSGLLLCEGSVMELPDGQLVCFMRENSGKGLGAFKCVSYDGGMTWDDPVEFPLPACHRPVTGMLLSGKVMITHRFMQGGKGWTGWWTQNLFAALTDVESCLATSRSEAHTRILPIDFDRHPHSDTGYSGWVQFPDGEIYIVNYLLDDAPKAQIRGYSLTEEDFILATA